MSRVDLHLGDCLEVMAGMPENSVDSVITDPPYGLSFMGKDWDHGVPGVRFWTAALRLAKPGAMLMAFGGTRTFHRLACAIEDAGWQMRDTMMWVYGCLSEDTEILTADGWRRYDTLSCTSTVMCYNVGDDSLEWGQVEDVYTYEISDTAYCIQSDRTDQLVTADHRCLVERGGKYVFERAASLQCQETIPVLEGVPGVWCSLPDPQWDTGCTKQAMQSSLYSKTHKSGQQRREAEPTQAGQLRMSCLQEAFLAPYITGQAHQYTNVQLSLQRDSAWAGVGQTWLQRTGSLVGGVGAGTYRQNDWRYQPILEGRHNLLPKARQLCTHQIRSLPCGFHTDGPQGWLHNGASPISRSTVGSMSQALRSCTSQGSRSNQQQPGQSDVVLQQLGPQEIRSQGATSPTLATVTPVHYNGIVWCVRVPAGAFVARRNGHVFVTGNSGFPKSHSISKAIDKAAGAEREVVGHHDWASPMTKPYTNAHYGGRRCRDDVPLPITVPATDAARLWAGWGTALKPAWEPIILAMAPLDGTFAQNAEKWGVAGLWIDGARVLTNDIASIGSPSWGGPMKRLSAAPGQKGKLVPRIPPTNNGRWPANLIHDGSDEVVGLFPANAPSGGRKAGQSWVRKGNIIYDGNTAPNSIVKRDYISDSGSAARFFYCAKASRKERNAGLDSTRAVKYNMPKSLRDGGVLWQDVSTALARSLERATSGSMVQWLIGESGANITALCPGDSLSITLTEISGITAPRILRSLTCLLTSESIAAASCATVCGGSPAMSAENSSQSQESTGTSPKKVIPYMDAVESAISELLSKASNEENWQPRTNIHSTVKPLALMEYLCKLTRTPTGGVVLDPFMGSGSTGIACVNTNRDFIGVEIDPDYFTIAEARIKYAQSQSVQMELPHV